MAASKSAEVGAVPLLSKLVTLSIVVLKSWFAVSLSAS
ncbi:hypothetical protein HSISB1_236 [Streptococcus sp. HSISB1]|nr:hypothetical protein HSISB1_236 [Streptococcus sp. HSISB1]